jgi:hypothetical protein
VAHLNRDQQDSKANSNASPALAAIDLPKPVPGASASIFAALEQRKTIREISETPLPAQLLAVLQLQLHDHSHRIENNARTSAHRRGRV